MPDLKKVAYYLSAVPLGYILRQLHERLRSYRHRNAGWQGGEALVARAAVISQSPLASLQSACPSNLNDRLASYLAEQYCCHRFDLLGSGWVDSGYDAIAAGLEGRVYNMNLALPPDLGDGAWLEVVVRDEHLPSSRSFWTILREINPAYQPIDWQRDRRSGFRWSAQQMHGKQSQLSRGMEGADIIQPWELSRLQHLPQLALIAIHQPHLRKKVVEEIQCQVLDFAAVNPVGMGVNWTCTMDVAIRAANLVMTHWLLASGGLHTQLHGSFAAEFSALIYRHGAFIRNNLEYNAGNTGNHYLANLSGLLFVTAFLEHADQVREWERYAVAALIREARRQFYPDGGHFEGASCYHALCTELLTFGAALASGNRSGVEIPGDLYQAVGRSVDLLLRMRSPGGNLIQLGDNDSGRLFRLVPRGDFISSGEARRCYQRLVGCQVADDEPYFDENMLDYSGVTDLFVPGTLENQLLAAMAKPEFFAGSSPYCYKQSTSTAAIAALRYTAAQRFSSVADLRAGLEMQCYPDSGLYFAISDALYLVISAHTNPGQKQNLSHSHNDKLGLELYIDGSAVLTDPGSYLYTPFASVRDRFRSVGAHNTLQVEGIEQNRFVDSFVSYPDACCTLVELSADAIELALSYRGIHQRRRVQITTDSVIVTDSCNRPFRQNWNDFPWESAGYGKLRGRA